MIASRISLLRNMLFQAQVLGDLDLTQLVRGKLIDALEEKCRELEATLPPKEEPKGVAA
jgi:hypothetical protein